MKREIETIEGLMSMMEAAYGDYVNGDASADELAECLYQEVSLSPETTAECMFDSLDCTPIIMVKHDWKGVKAAWKLELERIPEVGEALGSRMPSYRWVKHDVDMDLMFEFRLGDELDDLVEEKGKALIMF